MPRSVAILKNLSVGAAAFRSDTQQMSVRVDPYIDALRRLIASGDPNGLLLAERTIEEYWEGTPPRARKSGLLYIQQILHVHRDTLGRESRSIADMIDAYIEKKLIA